MNEITIQRTFFGVLLLVVTVAFVWLIRDFLQPIFWAIALGIVIFPLHTQIVHRLHDRRTLAAVASTLLVVVIVILPLAGVGVAVTTEATALYERLSRDEIELARIYQQLNEYLPQLVSALEAVGLEPQRLQEQLSTAAVEVSRYIASQALSIGQNTLRIAVFFFLMLYLLFFFLRDGVRILDSVVRALPLGDERERHLLGRFAEVSRATIKGTLVIGVVQGTIGGVTFAALGIGAPVLWGVVMALLSILPALGPAIVWVPAAVILFSRGDWISGIILVAVGTVVISLVDNVLRPILVGRDTRMPDYLILLSTLGGLLAFGLAGIVIGPVIAAFFLSTWEMAAEEYAAESLLLTRGEPSGAQRPGAGGAPSTLESDLLPPDDDSAV